MPKCKRCGSSNIVQHKDELRCGVCDFLITASAPEAGREQAESITYDKITGRAVLPATPSTSKPPPLTMYSGQQWEYNVVRCGRGTFQGLYVKAHQGSGQSAPDHIKNQPIGKAFDQLGKAGWELVSSETEPSVFGPIAATKTFIFKRPLRS